MWVCMQEKHIAETVIGSVFSSDVNKPEHSRPRPRNLASRPRPRINIPGHQSVWWLLGYIELAWDILTLFGWSFQCRQMELDSARHRPPTTMTHTEQQSGGELCKIVKIWSFLQLKPVNNAHKLLQLPPDLLPRL